MTEQAIVVAVPAGATSVTAAHEPPPPVESLGSALDELAYYTDERDKLAKLSVWSSGLALLLAMASRLPTWQVGSPAAWLIGSVNVGFVPIFGPLVIAGLFCYVIYTQTRVRELRRSLVLDRRLHSPFARAAVGEYGDGNTRAVVAEIAFDCWILVVPLIAYVILMFSYFDFVRPSADPSRPWAFPSRTGQVVDLIAGTGGWGGFRPLTPAIHDDLLRVAAHSEPSERARLESVAEQIPWIYPPLQTWAYFAMWFFMVWLAWGKIREWRRR